MSLSRRELSLKDADKFYLPAKFPRIMARRFCSRRDTEPADSQGLYLGLRTGATSHAVSCNVLVRTSHRAAQSSVGRLDSAANRFESSKRKASRVGGSFCRILWESGRLETRD